MSDINGALLPTQEYFFFNFNPNAFILTKNSSPFDFTLERGPRYRAYAELRESKLRMRYDLQQQEFEEPHEPKLTNTPPAAKKRVTFQSVGGVGGGIERNGTNGVSSMVAKSVPDFSSVLRKENRKPVGNAMETTPPSNSKKGVLKLGGSRSAGGGDKRGVMGRKSCASIEELKGMGSVVASAINGEGKGGGRNGRGTSATQKNLLGYRQYY